MLRNVHSNSNNNHNNNNNNNNNQQHNRNESVSISITISDIANNNKSTPNIRGARPSALSDPKGPNQNESHVRQVSFPRQFLGFARRASSGILQVMADKEEECCICLGEFTREDDIATLQCFHYFHKKCIIDWLQHEKPECPVCNTSATIAGQRPE